MISNQNFTQFDFRHFLRKFANLKSFINEENGKKKEKIRSI